MYKTVIKPAMMYGYDCWAIFKKRGNRNESYRNYNEKVDIQCNMDRTRNECIRGNLCVINIVGKIREINRLK